MRISYLNLIRCHWLRSLYVLFVQVTIGFAKYHCNCLQYYSSSHSDPSVIVGLVVGQGCALLIAVIIVVIIYVRRCRGHAHPAVKSSSRHVKSGKFVSKQQSTRKPDRATHVDLPEASLEPSRQYAVHLPDSEYSSIWNYVGYCSIDCKTICLIEFYSQECYVRGRNWNAHDIQQSKC